MKKIIACSLLGMNKLMYEDTGHPFEMGPLLAKYKDTKFLYPVTKKEQICSTFFYEMMHVFKTLNVYSNDIKFLFSRGTIGKRTEKTFAKELKKAYDDFNQDAFVVVVAKSYGCIDALHALKKATDVNVDLLVLVDGTAPFWSMWGVSKRTRMYGRWERVLTIPSNVSRVWTMAQDSSGLKGKLSNRGEQFIIEPPYLNSHKHTYNHYSDGYKRVLKVDHNDMEEIASIVPCFKYRGMMVNLPTLIKNIYWESL